MHSSRHHEQNPNLVGRHESHKMQHMHMRAAEGREPREPTREIREAREHRENTREATRDQREPREIAREMREPREVSRELREPPREHREMRDNRRMEIPAEEPLDDFDYKVSERLQEKISNGNQAPIVKKESSKPSQRYSSPERTPDQRRNNSGAEKRGPAEDFEPLERADYAERTMVYRPPVQERFVRPPSVRITPILKEKYGHNYEVIFYPRSSHARPRMTELEYLYPILKMMKEESNRPKPFLSKYSERFFFQALYHLIDYSRRTSALKFCYNCYSFRHRDSRKDQRFASRFMSDIFPYEDETESLIRERWTSFLDHTIDYFLHADIARPRGDGTHDFRLPSIGRCTSAHKENITGMSCKFIFFYKDRVGKVPPENPNHSTHLPWGSPTTYVTTSKAQRICRSSKLPSSRNTAPMGFHPAMRFNRFAPPGHPQYLGMGFVPRPLGMEPFPPEFGDHRGPPPPEHYYMDAAYQWDHPGAPYMNDGGVQGGFEHGGHGEGRYINPELGRQGPPMPHQPGYGEMAPGHWGEYREGGGREYQPKYEGSQEGGLRCDERYLAEEPLKEEEEEGGFREEGTLGKRGFGDSQAAGEEDEEDEEEEESVKREETEGGREHSAAKKGDGELCSSGAKGGKARVQTPKSGRVAASSSSRVQPEAEEETDPREGSSPEKPKPSVKPVSRAKHSTNTQA